MSTGDGVYTIDPDGPGGIAPMSAYCDMTTDGGGWTMVLNYLHQGNTNPALTVRTTDLPLRGSDTLGTDEFGTAYWGHAGNSLFGLLGATEIRFYGLTSAHGRAIHFKSTDPGCISYFGAGLGTCSTLPSSHTLLAGHTAFLPATADGFYINNGDQAMTQFPFFTSGAYHWGIAGNGYRWEVDDPSVNDDNHTLHRIFVRSIPKGTSCLDILGSGQSYGNGTYLIDPDSSGPTVAFATYCDMTTAGGGWMLVAIYGDDARPTSWSGNAYPRPGASFYGTLNVAIFDPNNNNSGIANFSIDAAALWSISNRQILGYVGGATDDFITAQLPAGCNFFDGATWCAENTYGPFTVYESGTTAITTDAYACTTAANNAPYGTDPHNEFGLHLINGIDNYGLHCHQTNSMLGHQDLGRIFTTFEGSGTMSTFWSAGVHSHWNESGSFDEPGALLIR